MPEIKHRWLPKWSNKNSQPQLIGNIIEVGCRYDIAALGTKTQVLQQLEDQLQQTKADLDQKSSDLEQARIELRNKSGEIERKDASLSNLQEHITALEAKTAQSHQGFVVVLIDADGDDYIVSRFRRLC